MAEITEGKFVPVIESAWLLSSCEEGLSLALVGSYRKHCDHISRAVLSKAVDHFRRAILETSGTVYPYTDLLAGK